MKLLVIMSIMLCSLIDNTAGHDEKKYKALFISQFTKYIKWPDSSGSTKIAVIGDSELAKFLEEFSTKKDLNFDIDKTNSLTAVSMDVDVIFISNMRSNLIKQITTKYEGLPVLIVSEKNGLCKKGSAINFVLKDDKLAFEINEKTLTQHKLKVASQLKSLAISI